MEFRSSEFSRMRYDVHSVSNDQDILQEIPELAAISEICDIPEIYNGLFRTAIVKYIAYMYDPGTPVYTMVPDVMKRRFYSAELADLPKQNSVRFTPSVEKILTGEDKLINDAIVSFVAKNNSALYTKLVVYLTALELQLKAILAGGYKSDALEAVDLLEKGISDITRKILNEDSARFTLDALYDKVRSEKLQLRPEDIADKIREGEDPVDIKPYGEDYKFPKNEWNGVKLLADIPKKGK